MILQNRNLKPLFRVELGLGRASLSNARVVIRFSRRFPPSYLFVLIFRPLQYRVFLCCSLAMGKKVVVLQPIRGCIGSSSLDLNRYISPQQPKSRTVCTSFFRLPQLLSLISRTLFMHLMRANSPVTQVLGKRLTRRDAPYFYITIRLFVFITVESYPYNLH